MMGKEDGGDMTPLEYYAECLANAAEELSVTLTDEQLQCLADATLGAAEHFSEAFGHDVAASNRSAEIEREREAGWEAANREREKIHCRTCDGSGRERYSAGPWAVNSHCSKCNGEGRHDP